MNEDRPGGQQVETCGKDRLLLDALRREGTLKPGEIWTVGIQLMAERTCE